MGHTCSRPPVNHPNVTGTDLERKERRAVISLAEEFMLRAVQDLKDRYKQVPQDEWDDTILTCLHTLCEMADSAQNPRMFCELLHEVVAWTTQCDRHWAPRMPIRQLAARAVMALRAAPGKDSAASAVDMLHDLIHVGQEQGAPPALVFECAHEILHHAKMHQIVQPYMAKRQIVIASR